MSPRRLAAAAGVLATGAALCAASPASAATVVPHRPAVTPAARPAGSPAPSVARPFAGGSFDVVGNSLTKGSTLTKGQVLVSLGLPAGSQTTTSSTGYGTYLILQDDGNLVEYAWTTNAVLWQSGTVGAGDHLTMQADGNLVLYTADAKPLINTQTEGTTFDTFSLLGNGQLAVFDSTTGADPSATFKLWGAALTPLPGNVWAQAISPDGHYAFVVQGDGNLVIYSTVGETAPHPIWNTRTDGVGPVTLAAQADGNLVAYAARDGRVVFQSNSRGVLNGQPDHFFTQLDMQDDGNLVLYATGADAQGKTVRIGALWSSGTRNVI